jgi:hypothetical protein
LYGYDEVSTKILKISTPFIISPLNFTCNKALSTGMDYVTFNVSGVTCMTGWIEIEIEILRMNTLSRIEGQ